MFENVNCDCFLFQFVKLEMVKFLGYNNMQKVNRLEAELYLHILKNIYTTLLNTCLYLVFFYFIVLKEHR